jgi:hypothetical protein
MNKNCGTSPIINDSATYTQEDHVGELQRWKAYQA